MAMTKRKAERLTGYDIRLIRHERGRFTFGAFRGTDLVGEANDAFDEFALAALVEKVHAIHSSVATARTVARTSRATSNQFAGRATASFTSSRIEVSEKETKMRFARELYGYEAEANGQARCYSSLPEIGKNRNPSARSALPAL